MEKIRKTTDLSDYNLCHEIDCRMGERQLKILSIYLKCLLGVGLLFLICWLAGYWLPDLRMACEFLSRLELGIFFVGLLIIIAFFTLYRPRCPECRRRMRGVYLQNSAQGQGDHLYLICEKCHKYAYTHIGNE